MENVQKMISNILMVQAISPPVVCGLPLVYLVFMAVLNIDSTSISVEIFDLVFSMVSIVNPLMSIYFVKPYRDTVFNFFKKRPNQITAGMSLYVVTEDSNAIN